MPLRRIAAIAAATLVALAAQRLAAVPARDARPTRAAERASDEAEVRSALASFIGALNELRWDDFRAWFADDVTLFNPEIPEAASLGRIDGRDAVERSFRRVFDEARRRASGPPYMHIVPRNVRVQAAGGGAVATFEFDRDDGTLGRRTFVYRRSPDGWRIVHIHASNTSKRE